MCQYVARDGHATPWHIVHLGGLANSGAGVLFIEAQQAEDIIAGGQADMVALARAMLYNPRWGWHAAAQLGATVSAPAPYWRAPP
jgi:NADPH2 dehydrogenase